MREKKIEISEDVLDKVLYSMVHSKETIEQAIGVIKQIKDTASGASDGQENGTSST